MCVTLTSGPGDMFSLETVSDFRCVTGALSLISVIAVINVAYDVSVRKRRMSSVWRAALQLAAVILYSCRLSADSRIIA